MDRCSEDGRCAGAGRRMPGRDWELKTCSPHLSGRSCSPPRRLRLDVTSKVRQLEAERKEEGSEGEDKSDHHQWIKIQCKHDHVPIVDQRRAARFSLQNQNATVFYQSDGPVSVKTDVYRLLKSVIFAWTVFENVYHSFIF